MRLLEISQSWSVKENDLHLLRSDLKEIVDFYRTDLNSTFTVKDLQAELFAWRGIKLSLTCLTNFLKLQMRFSYKKGISTSRNLDQDELKSKFNDCFDWIRQLVRQDKLLLNIDESSFSWENYS